MLILDFAMRILLLITFMIVIAALQKELKQFSVSDLKDELSLIKVLKYTISIVLGLIVIFSAISYIYYEFFYFKECH